MYVVKLHLVGAQIDVIDLEGEVLYRVAELGDDTARDGQIVGLLTLVGIDTDILGEMSELLRVETHGEVGRFARRNGRLGVIDAGAAAVGAHIADKQRCVARVGEREGCDIGEFPEHIAHLVLGMVIDAARLAVSREGEEGEK